jgi:hypothetical protein
MDLPTQVFRFGPFESRPHSSGLWSSETLVDFEHGLNTAVKEPRAVLDDSALRPRYIQTLPKVGCDLIASHECVSTLTASLPSTIAETPRRLAERFIARNGELTTVLLTSG